MFAYKESFSGENVIYVKLLIDVIKSFLISSIAHLSPFKNNGSLSLSPSKESILDTILNSISFLNFSSLRQLITKGVAMTASSISSSL